MKPKVTWSSGNPRRTQKGFVRRLVGQRARVALLPACWMWLAQDPAGNDPRNQSAHAAACAHKYAQGHGDDVDETIRLSCTGRTNAGASSHRRSAFHLAGRSVRQYKLSPLLTGVTYFCNRCQTQVALLSGFRRLHSCWCAPRSGEGPDARKGRARSPCQREPRVRMEFAEEGPTLVPLSRRFRYSLKGL